MSIIIKYRVRRQKMNILDELEDFINQTCIVKRNKKSQGMSKCNSAVLLVNEKIQQCFMS